MNCPTLYPSRGYTIEVENKSGRAIWATAFVPGKRRMADLQLHSKTGIARFRRMVGTCLIYREIS